MTDNEKAATFTGWSTQSADPAPDMSNPQYYMDALVAITYLGYEPTLEFHRMEKPPNDYSFWALVLEEGEFEGRGPTPGEAIINTLVQLYDKLGHGL